MAIRVRRGNEADFDANKMLPGEWAVSLDTKYVRMCFAPGVCLRMATYEGFESDMERVEAILTEVESIEEVVRRIRGEVETNAEIVVEHTELAKEYARQAKESADRAAAVEEIDYASSEKAGIVAPQEVFVDKENGKMFFISESKNSPILKNSFNGEVRFINFEGNSVQLSTPAPTSKADIQRVVINKIKTCGKNLVDYFQAKEKHKLPFNIAAGVYTISFDVDVTSAGAENCSCTMYDARTNVFNMVSNGARVYGNHVEITLEPNFTVGYISISSDYAISNIMLVPGNSASDYEPFVESEVLLTNPIVLNGNESVKDCLCRKNGMWTVERHFESLHMDEDIVNRLTMTTSGTNNFCLINGLLNGIAKYDNKNGNVKNYVISNYFTNYSQFDIQNAVYDNGMSLSSTGSVYFRIKDYLLEDYKEFFNQNDVEFMYELLNTKYEVLPLSEQILLNSLTSFDGTTYVGFDSLVVPNFHAEYGNSKIGCYVLKTLSIAELNQARIDELTGNTKPLEQNVWEMPMDTE